jgi:hypothetical protein
MNVSLKLVEGSDFFVLASINQARESEPWFRVRVVLIF